MNLEHVVPLLIGAIVFAPIFWLLSHSNAQISGLLQLATHYRVKKYGRGPSRNFVTILSSRPAPHRQSEFAVSGATYFLGFHVAFTRRGLVLSPMFEFITHAKTLLIPYKDIAGARVKGIFKDGFEITALAEPEIIIGFSGQGRWMEKHLNKRGIETQFVTPRRWKTD